MPKILLTWEEVRFAVGVGATRRIDSLKKGFGNAPISRLGDWQIDIVGAIGELAVAKSLGVYWIPTVGTFKLPDVGVLNVRATDVANGRLILRQKDPPGVYVLVIVKANECNVAGWITTLEAHVDRFRAQPDPAAPACWAVPQDQLHLSLDELREKKRGRLQFDPASIPW